MMSFLGSSYCRTNAGKYAQAYSRPTVENSAEETQRRAFEAKMRPLWAWLLANCDVHLVVDPEHPDTSIWAWMVTSGPDVLHAIGCKTSVIEAGLCHDVVMELLGERWKTPQVLTLELPQMRASNPGWKRPKAWFGFDRPAKWWLDPTWFAVRMVGR